MDGSEGVFLIFFPLLRGAVTLGTVVAVPEGLDVREMEAGQTRLVDPQGELFDGNNMVESSETIVPPGRASSKPALDVLPKLGWRATDVVLE